MALIEGIGDEVLVFVGLIIILVIMAVGWMSTRVSSYPLVHIVIFDREIFRNILQLIQRNGQQQTRNSNPVPVPAEETANTSPDNEPSAHESSTAIDSPDTNVTTCTEIDLQSAESADHSSSASVSPELNSAELSSVMGHPTADRHLAEDAAADVEIAADSDSHDAPGSGQKMPVNIRYLDDSTTTVEATCDETVGHFRRNHFASEMNSNNKVRFVYRGHELSDDSRTLQSYGVTENCTLHCLISKIQPEQTPLEYDSRQLDIGALVFPIFGLILIVLWYARIAYRGYFNGASTFSLIGISFVYVIALLTSFRGGNLQHIHVD